MVEVWQDVEVWRCEAGQLNVVVLVAGEIVVLAEIQAEMLLECGVCSLTTSAPDSNVDPWSGVNLCEPLGWMVKEVG